MALTTCIECGKEISTSAKVCPHCGTPKPHKEKTTPLTWFVLLAIIAIVISAISGGGTSSQPVSAPTPAETAASSRDTINIQNGVKARRLLIESLRDPDSLSIDNAFATTDGVICLDFKAKNGFGGMNVSNAIYIPSSGAFATSEMKGFAKKWNYGCANKKGTELYL